MSHALPALTAFLAFAAAANADVVIVSRHSELHDSYSQPYPPPGTSYGDNVSTDDISAGTLTAPHGATFVSSVTPQTIHAVLHSGLVSYGASGNFQSSSNSTSFDVVFQVTQVASLFSLHIQQGGSFPGVDNQGNVNLTLTNTATSATVYNLYTSTPPTVVGIPPGATWNPTNWQVTLEPGTYRLHGIANVVLGDGGTQLTPYHGNGYLDFTATLTPTPGAAALVLLVPIAARRRRV